MDKDSYFNNLKKSLDSENYTQERQVAPKEDDGLKSIRTFKSDINDTVKENNISYSKVAMEEAEHNRKLQGLVTAPKTHILRNSLLLLASICIIGAGGALVYSIYNYIQVHESQQVAVLAPTSLIPSDTQTTISVPVIDRTSIAQAIQTERNKKIAAGSIETAQLEVTPSTGSTTAITAEELFNIFGPNIAGPTLRSFEDPYTFGFYGNGNRKDTFMILKINSYDDAYGGMLEWEKYMNIDLQNFLIIPFVQVSTSSIPLESGTGSSTATSTPSSIVVTSTSTIPINYTFQDEVVANKDARVLKDTQGNTVFLYSFLDEQTLVLATSESALTEIQNRLLSLKRVQ